MKTLGKRLFALCVLAALCCLFAMPVLAASPTDSGSETAVGEMQTEEKQDATGEKAMAAAICVGLAAAAGAIGMGIAISKWSNASPFHSISPLYHRTSIFLSNITYKPEKSVCEGNL